MALNPLAAHTVAPSEPQAADYSGLARAASGIAGAVTKSRQQSAFADAQQQEAEDGTLFLSSLDAQYQNQLSRDVQSGLITEEERSVFQSGDAAKQSDLARQKLIEARNNGTATASHVQRSLYMEYVKRAAMDPAGAQDLAKSIGLTGDGPTSFESQAKREQEILEENADEIRDILGGVGYDTTNLNDDQVVTLSTSEAYQRAMRHKRRQAVLNDRSLSVEERKPEAMKTWLTDSVALGTDVQGLAEDIFDDPDMSTQDKLISYQQQVQALGAETLSRYSDFPELQVKIREATEKNIQMGNDYISGALDKSVYDSSAARLEIQKRRDIAETRDIEGSVLDRQISLVQKLANLSDHTTSFYLNDAGVDLDTLKKKIAGSVGELGAVSEAVTGPMTDDQAAARATFAAPPTEDDRLRRVDVVTTGVVALLNDDQSLVTNPEAVEKMVAIVEESGTAAEVKKMHESIADALLSNPELQQKVARSPALGTVLKSSYKVVQGRVGQALGKLEERISHVSLGTSFGRSSKGASGGKIDMANVARIDEAALAEGKLKFVLAPDSSTYLSERGMRYATEALADINVMQSQGLTDNINAMALMQQISVGKVVENLLGGNPALADLAPGTPAAVGTEGTDVIGDEMVRRARAYGATPEEAKKVIEDNPWITAIQATRSAIRPEDGEASDSAPLAGGPEVAAQKTSEPVQIRNAVPEDLTPSGGAPVQGDVPTQDDGSEFGVQLSAARGPDVFTPEPYVPQEKTSQATPAATTSSEKAAQGGTQKLSEKPFTPADFQKSQQRVQEAATPEALTAAADTGTEALAHAAGFTPGMAKMVRYEGNVEYQSNNKAKGNPNGVKLYENGVFHPYKDSKGNWTIGFGHLIGDGSGSFDDLPDNLKDGISVEETVKQFQKDHTKAEKGTKALMKHRGVDFDGLPPEVQELLVDMGFNMGTGDGKRKGGLAGWRQLYTALKARDWEGVARSLEGSKWRNDVKERAVEHIATIRGLVQ